MMYPLVRDLAVDGIPVTVTCEVLEVARQPYYRWLADPVTDREFDDAHLVEELRALHDEDPEFGYRFLADELVAAGQTASENRVHRLCREHEIWSTTTRKGRKNTKKAGPPVGDDLVQRDFTADTIDTLWLTDITEHRTREGKVYLCAIKDACSRAIVGWAMGPRMKASLAVTALEVAVARRAPGPGVIVHSDRGSQFRSRKFQKALRRHELRGSMGRVGAAGDNAAMESFFSLLQKNVLDRHDWETRDQLQHAVLVWMVRTYNTRRRQRALGKLSPAAFELLLEQHHTALAA